jgi:FkbM family methyltransferase
MDSDRLPRLDGCNQLVQTRHGMMLYNINDSIIGRSLQLYGEWAESEMELFGQLLTPGDITVDVGAYIGTHALFFSRRVGPAGSVWCLEPQRLPFQILAGNIAINSLTNCRLLHAAASSVSGSQFVPLLDPEVPGDMSLCRPSARGEGEEVLAVSVDDLGLKKCRLLKINVNGAELPVLRGCSKLLSTAMPWLFLKHNHVGETSATIISFLLDAGYSLYWHLGFLFRPNNFFGNAENIFAQQFEVSILGVHREAGAKMSNFTPVISAEDTWEEALKRSQLEDAHFRKRS